MNQRRKRKLPGPRPGESETARARAAELEALLVEPITSPVVTTSMPTQPVSLSNAPAEMSLAMRWNPERPRILVVACSDGRLQEPTDAFLSRQLGITHYDRLYVPGGAGALSPSGRDFFRAHQVQQECRYLVELHRVELMIALFHGPAADGPDAAMCADYRRKFSFAGTMELRSQQEQDAKGLVRYRWEWARQAKVHVYRCEVGATGDLSFVTLHADA